MGIGLDYMSNDEEIVIKIGKEKLARLKDLGVSVQDVFSKGFYELLKERYCKYVTSDDDIDDLIESEEFIDFIEKNDDVPNIIIPERILGNN
jgi:hypothetical protein